MDKWVARKLNNPKLMSNQMELELSPHDKNPDDPQEIGLQNLNRNNLVQNFEGYNYEPHSEPSTIKCLAVNRPLVKSVGLSVDSQLSKPKTKLKQKVTITGRPTKVAKKKYSFNMSWFKDPKFSSWLEKDHKQKNYNDLALSLFVKQQWLHTKQKYVDIVNLLSI